MLRSSLFKEPYGLIDKQEIDIGLKSSFKSLECGQKKPANDRIRVSNTLGHTSLSLNSYPTVYTYYGSTNQFSKQNSCVDNKAAKDNSYLSE